MLKRGSQPFTFTQKTPPARLTTFVFSINKSVFSATNSISLSHFSAATGPMLRAALLLLLQTRCLFSLNSLPSTPYRLVIVANFFIINLIPIVILILPIQSGTILGIHSKHRQRHTTTSTKTTTTIATEPTTTTKATRQPIRSKKESKR